MQAPDPIETIMARLMPPALSEDGQREMDAMIEELAGPDKVVGISSTRWLARSLIGGGIAAAIGALWAVFPLMPRSFQGQVASTSEAGRHPGAVLMSESDRVESMTDDGWKQDSEGSAMHSVRVEAVKEKNVRDGETGIVVRISEPREEILMMPVRDIGAAPALRKPIPGEMVQTAALPAERDGPVRVVNIAGQSASFSAAEGRAVVRRVGDIYHLKIAGPRDEGIFDGVLAKEGKLEEVPESWRRRIQVLCRTLDQALDGSLMTERQPRPRVAPPVSQKP